MLTAIAKLSWDNQWWRVLSGTIEYVPAFMLTPRLVLSLRELYARDVRGRCGSEIDTAFGLTSISSSTVTSGIIFLDTGQDESDEQDEARGEAIQLDEREICTTGGGAV